MRRLLPTNWVSICTQLILLQNTGTMSLSIFLPSIKRDVHRTRISCVIKKSNLRRFWNLQPKISVLILLPPATMSAVALSTVNGRCCAVWIIIKTRATFSTRWAKIISPKRCFLWANSKSPRSDGSLKNRGWLLRTKKTLPVFVSSVSANLKIFWPATCLLNPAK